MMVEIRISVSKVIIEPDKNDGRLFLVRLIENVSNFIVVIVRYFNVHIQNKLL